MTGSIALQGLLLACLLIWAMRLLLRQGWFHGAKLVLCGGVVLTLGVALVCASRQRQQARAADQLLQRLPHEGRPGGYLSSDECRSCHPSEYASWYRSYHRTMTQFVSPKTVVGNFEDVQLAYEGRTYNLKREGDQFWVEMDDPEWKPTTPDGRASAQNALSQPPRIKRRIGMVTGSHQMQVYWVPGHAGNVQIVLPFTYLFEAQRWVPRKDIFLKDPSLPQAIQLWNTICIQCHTTAGQPRADLQNHLLDTRTAEIGIACEACHGPGEAHARANRDPLRRYLSHENKDIDPTIFHPSRHASKVASQICGQCHGIKLTLNKEDWLQNGFPYRPGGDFETTTPTVRPGSLAAQPWLPESIRRDPSQLQLEGQFWSDGMVRVSGREYNGLIESPCYQHGNLSCLSCHSMHQSNPVNQLAAQMASNEACLQCHTTFRARLEQHTHHPATSAGSLCYNCHMPYTSYGLLRALRSHQVTSPDVAVSLQTGRPDACNLCHLDRTLGWAAKQLSQWYRVPAVAMSAEQQSISGAVIWLLRGDAGQRALIAWSMGWKPAREASGQAWIPPFLAQLLEDPYAAVRFVAQRSLKQLDGYSDLAYDYVGPEEGRQLAHNRALAIWRQHERLDRKSPGILIKADGSLDEAAFLDLLRQRDDHRMVLHE